MMGNYDPHAEGLFWVMVLGACALLVAVLSVIGAVTVLGWLF